LNYIKQLDLEVILNSHIQLTGITSTV